jgi:peptidoglycan/xylan/chitin deacetylase (PgdA/CDA1 family)
MGFGLVVCAIIGAAVGLYLAGGSNRERTNQSGTAPHSSSQTSLSHNSRRESQREADALPIADDLVVTPDQAKPPTHFVPRHSHPRGYPGEILYNESEGKVALTFDAGASNSSAPIILDTLAQYRVHATFFLTGKWCETSPELVKRIVREGHEIANHTYSHPDLRRLADAEIATQLQDMADALYKVAGVNPIAYFRPPYGSRDNRVIEASAVAGYKCIYWSLDSLDAFKKGITAQEIHDRVIEHIEPGDIVLMHCGSSATAEALPGILNVLRERGLTPVKITELIE